MSTMKAAVVTGFGKPLQIQELPVPEPAAGQILVKIEASGVCHTDLHAAEGDWPVKPKPPFIPGHEGSGVVVAVGRGTKNGVKEGDRVGYHGCIAPAAIAITACPDGRRCAKARRMGAIPSMADSRNMPWRIRSMWRTFQRSCRQPVRRLFSAPA